MSLRNRLFLSLALPALAALVACGGSGSSRPVPPPSGGFTNSNLNGTYVFSSSGSDLNGGILVFVGSFSANGSGGITGGNLDVNGIEVGPSSVPITGGSYSVTADGRGHVTLKASSSVDTSNTFDFVLTSSSHGLITEYDGDGSGSGTLDLQSAVSQADLTGKYVFNLAGWDAAGNPMSTAGVVTLDGSGNATGIQDLNDSESYSAINIGSGSNVLAGTPGTASIGSFGFDVYPIDATHLKFIETDSQGFMSGDVFSQSSSAFPTGAMVFTMAGVDFQIGTNMVLGGMMNSDGVSAINGGLEDFNDGGNIDTDGTNITPLSFTGSFNPSGGRFFLTLNSFLNGQNGTVGTFTFAAYPSTGGLQLLEVDGDGVTGGVAFAQTNTSFASGQGYGMNLSAFNLGSGFGGFEEDDIAEFTNNSTNLRGLLDVNDMGSPSSPQNFSGTYQADSSNAGRGLINSNFFTLISYTADANTTVMIEIDGGQTGLGTIGLQNTSSAQLATKMASLKPRSIARMKGLKHEAFKLRGAILKR